MVIRRGESISLFPGENPDLLFRESNLHLLDELQRCGVHAIAQICRLGAVVKDMAEMRFAFGAGNFRPSRPQACVHGGSDIFIRDRRPETWPTGS